MTNKVELNTLTQVVHKEQAFLVALNENFLRLQRAINDTLSRTGVVPNQMEEVLDMNGKRVINVGAAVEDTDALTRGFIKDLIAQVEAAVARLNTLVEEAKQALAVYANEYILPPAIAARDAAEVWAQGTDEQVEALGGEHSAKGWSLLVIGDISGEEEARIAADNALQQQIDAIVASSDVRDIVGTYAELLAYDTSHLGDQDIIKVIADETHGNASSYYRWIKSGNSGSWSYIGSEGPYLTAATAAATYIPKTAIATSISAASTDNEVASAKLLYDTCGDIEALINAL